MASRDISANVQAILDESDSDDDSGEEVPASSRVGQRLGAKQPTTSADRDHLMDRIYN